MKESFEELKDDPSGNLIIHGHDLVIDLFNEGYNESINGARIKDESFKINLNRLHHNTNAEGYSIGHWLMIFRQGYKMSQVFDRLPYGIIDKTITGLGATTLEIMSDVRNSIIVVPTKALAYNKYLSANNEKKENYCLYVGSTFGEITKDIHIEAVQAYINSRENKVKKFVVVADSLPMLLDYLTTLEIDVFGDYFLMVDEIDTMQDDSAYRPKLEMVIDNYFRFKYYHRAAVSATIREFSDPRLNNEARLRIEWEEQPKRDISVLHTNYVDDMAWHIINARISQSQEKILVAYNSIDGIINIIKHLNIDSKECGILCSERSVSKVKSFLLDASDVIDSKGLLIKRVTFMTCAYFAGIDIFDKCHLMSVSTKLQPFTYLSLNKLTQIAGRLRNGSLSETIIYDTSEEKNVNGSPKQYRNELLNRANKYAELLNTMGDLTSNDVALSPLNDFLNSYADYAQRSKSTYTSYPLTIVRQNTLTKRYVPAYLNIDALVENLKLKTVTYQEKLTLVRSLKRAGHTVSTYVDVLIPMNHHDGKEIWKIKKCNQSRLIESFGVLADSLLEWHLQGRNPYRLKEIRRETDKRLQENVIDVFEAFSEHVDAHELLEGLEGCCFHNRSLRNFFNSVVFHILPINHPFKAALLQSFKVDMQNFSSEEYYTTRVRHALLREQLRAICKYEYDCSPSVLSDLLNSFFCWARSGKGDRIKGLNPSGLSKPIKYMAVEINLIGLLRFPR